MNIKRIEISQFRHLTNVNFDFGKHITVIAGGNGTGKTSLLGLIGHVFKYGAGTRNILDDKFETKFSQVFRFSPNHDHNKQYAYKLIFDDNTTKDAEFRTIIENGKTRYRIDVGGRVQGGGKIKKPVIFLSLRRLLPLAQEDERRIQIGLSDLTDAQKELYKSYYRSIFTGSEDVTPVHTKSYYKNTFSPTSTTYDSHGISAGQDNIGNIILSLLSFRVLMENSPEDYTGGILLIDEIDATLYPAAQKNLLILLLKEAKELNLQIIFTTHSSDILNFLSSKKASGFKHCTNFVSLSNALGAVEVKQGFSELKNLLADLNHEALLTIKPKRINFYFEDNEAYLFYKNIIQGIDFGCDNNYKNLSVSCGMYKTLLEQGFEEFFRSVVVLDGDFKDKFPTAMNHNVVFLPGIERPENEVKTFLDNLDETDSFWNNAPRYTKRVFIQNSIGLRDDREVMKRWFNEELQYWGDDCSRLFQRWKELNIQDANTVINRTRTVITSILDNYYELSLNK